MPTLNPSPIRKPPLIIASDVKVRELTWLWYPYIPSHAATLLFGPGGMGKSHITVEIAAALSNGLPLPGQEMATAPQKVLMLSAEDEFDAVLVPRLMRQGAKLTNIAFPADPFTLDEKGLARLEEYMREFAATIVFIDPIVSYMGGKVDMFRANEVRAFMGPLHKIAVRTGTTIIIVGHSRKSSEGEDFEKAMGSADFNNAVRSVLFATKGNDGHRVMRHVKSNYAPLGPTMGFSFDDAGTFQWDGIVEEDDTFTGLPAQNRPNHGKAAINAVAFIKNVLKYGPVKAKEVELMAKDEKINPRTLTRAKVGLAESFMVWEDGKPVWYWKLSEPEGDKTEVSGVDDRFGAAASGGADSPMEPGAGGNPEKPVLRVGTDGPSPQDPKQIAIDFLRARGIDPEDPENKGTWVGALANGGV